MEQKREFLKASKESLEASAKLASEAFQDASLRWWRRYLPVIPAIMALIATGYAAFAAEANTTQTLAKITFDVAAFFAPFALIAVIYDGLIDQRREALLAAPDLGYACLHKVKFNSVWTKWWKILYVLRGIDDVGTAYMVMTHNHHHFDKCERTTLPEQVLRTNDPYPTTDMTPKYFDPRPCEHNEAWLQMRSRLVDRRATAALTYRADLIHKRKISAEEASRLMVLAYETYGPIPEIPNEQIPQPDEKVSVFTQREVQFDERGEPAPVHVHCSA